MNINNSIRRLQTRTQVLEDENSRLQQEFCKLRERVEGIERSIARLEAQDKEDPSEAPDLPEEETHDHLQLRVRGASEDTRLDETPGSPKEEADEPTL